MLRVLTLATLFPNRLQPNLGVFVERQTSGLAALPDVEVEVIAPVGMPPWPLSRHPHYAQRRALPEREIWKGLEVHRPRYPVLPVIGTRRTATRMARSLLPRLEEIRRRFPFHVIDAEFFWPDGPCAVALGKALGVPVSIKARGSDINFWSRNPAVRPQLVAAAKGAGGLLAVSGALKQAMVALGMPEERIRVHYTGVDLTQFVPVDRAAARKALGVAGPLLVGVGALIEGKGYGLAIEALAGVPEATLMLVGEGPERPALERLAAELGISDRVRLLGARPHAEIAALLAAADVTVHPSRAEGLANVWVESLACGTPVVSSAAGGAAEVITAEAGRLVQRDAGAIAAAVRELLARPPDPADVRRAAIRFSWEANARQLRDHLMAISAAA